MRDDVHEHGRVWAGATENDFREFQGLPESGRADDCVCFPLTRLVQHGRFAVRARSVERQANKVNIALHETGRSHAPRQSRFTNLP